MTTHPKLNLNDRITAKTAMDILGVDEEGLKYLLHRHPFAALNRRGEYFWSPHDPVSGPRHPINQLMADTKIELQRRLGIVNPDFDTLRKYAALCLPHEQVHEMVFFRNQVLKIKRLIEKPQKPRPESSKGKRIRLIKKFVDSGMAAEIEAEFGAQGALVRMKKHLEEKGIDGEKAEPLKRQDDFNDQARGIAPEHWHRPGRPSDPDIYAWTDSDADIE
jgi:hypothetical protein